MNQLQQITVAILTVLGAFYTALSVVALAPFLPQSVRTYARFLALDIASLSGLLGRPVQTEGLTPDAVKQIVRDTLNERESVVVVPRFSAVLPAGAPIQQGSLVTVASDGSVWPAAKPIAPEDTLTDLPKTVFESPALAPAPTPKDSDK